MTFDHADTTLETLNDHDLSSPIHVAKVYLTSCLICYDPSPLHVAKVYLTTIPVPYT